MAKEHTDLDCARCDTKPCREGKDCSGLAAEVADKYENQYVQRIMRVASEVEAEYYMKKCRLEEVIEFAKRMNFKHLGIAFCIGLSNETKVLMDILEDSFTISSVCCAVCGISKDTFGLPQLDEQNKETMCNPIGQAEILNRQKTDLNLIVGLCIGHDIQFTNFSKAPVSTLVVKDRVLAHNPIGAIYSRYYHRIKFPHILKTST
jgi:uncharacterized metal-binding protein